MIVHDTCSYKKSLELITIPTHRKTKIIFLTSNPVRTSEKLKDIYPSALMYHLRRNEVKVVADDVIIHLIDYMGLGRWGMKADLVIVKDVKISGEVWNYVLPTVTHCVAMLNEAVNKGR